MHATDRDAAEEIAAGCPKVGGIEVCGVQAISAVRVLSYDPKLKMLLSDVAEEYVTLRNGTLFEQTGLQLKPNDVHEFAMPARKGLAMTVNHVAGHAAGIVRGYARDA